MGKHSEYIFDCGLIWTSRIGLRSHVVGTQRTLINSNQRPPVLNFKRTEPPSV